MGKWETFFVFHLFHRIRCGTPVFSASYKCCTWTLNPPCPILDRVFGGQGWESMMQIFWTGSVESETRAVGTYRDCAIGRCHLRVLLPGKWRQHYVVLRRHEHSRHDRRRGRPAEQAIAAAKEQLQSFCAHAACVSKPRYGVLVIERLSRKPGRKARKIGFQKIAEPNASMRWMTGLPNSR